MHIRTQTSSWQYSELDDRVDMTNTRILQPCSKEQIHANRFINLHEYRHKVRERYGKNVYTKKHLSNFQTQNFNSPSSPMPHLYIYRVKNSLNTCMFLVVNIYLNQVCHTVVRPTCISVVLRRGTCAHERKYKHSNCTHLDPVSYLIPPLVSCSDSCLVDPHRVVGSTESLLWEDAHCLCAF